MNLVLSPLYSSSSGNCTYVGSEAAGILIDAGTTGVMIETALKSIGKPPKALNGILITHEHADHIKSVGMLSRKYDIPVFANEGTWQAIDGKIGEISKKNMRIIQNEEFFIGDLLITPIPLSHDCISPTGFAVACKGKKVSVLTDTGKFTKEMLRRAEKSDIVLLEANHDEQMLKCGRYPYYLKMRILSGKGHLSNIDSGKAAVALAKTGVRGVLLGHLSKENNFEELAYQTVSDALLKENIRPGKDIALSVTKKAAVTGYFTL